MSIRLYSYWRSSAAYRVRIALNLKGLAHEIVPVSLAPAESEHRKEKFRSINPQMLVPFLEDGDIAIGQSMAKSRPLCAGCIVGSGTVSNKLNDGPGKQIEEGGVGYSCIAELRTIETLNDGKPTTSFMKFGDRIRIEMRNANGESIFGTIDQVVEKYQP